MKTFLLLSFFSMSISAAVVVLIKTSLLLTLELIELWRKEKNLSPQDYDAQILGTIDSEKGKVVRIELKAKNNKVTYGKIEYFLLEKDATPLEAIFFAVSGKPLKRAKFMDFKKIDGEMRTTKMVIQDFVQKDKESTLIFADHKKEKMDPSMFNKDSLDF